MRKLALFVLLGGLLAGCRKGQTGADASHPAVQEPETISVSNWTGKTELFMEYQPLVTTVKRRFAVHFTDLSSFKPLTKGSVTVALKRNGLEAESFSTTAPSRPGIFGVDVQPKRAGRYSMSVTLNAEPLRDTHEVGEVVVYSDPKEIPGSQEEPGEEQISFLKEQQWTLDFATALAQRRKMRESIVVSGDVRPRSGGEVEVATPVSGRVSPSGRLPVIGTLVEQGQTLASIVPLTPVPADRPALELSISEARTALDLARRDLARAERLLAAGAVPARRVDEARAVEATAAARLAAAERRLQQFEASRQGDGSGSGESAFVVRAPISGVISQVGVTAGANVTQGGPLFRVVAVDQVYVAANVPEAQLPRVSTLNGAEVEVTGSVRLPAGRLIAKSSVIHPEARTLSFLFAVPNPGRTLAIGQSVSVRLFLSGTVDAVTVPEPAVIDDGGRPVVFVQKEGEAFARRPVTLGIRENGFVQITQGVQPGERVVTKGAYLIRLAALSSQIPAHGHVH
ncbi:MAG: efflux RND transporter periplasmic adaptor subunit [Bryobacteraceae bacterium]